MSTNHTPLCRSVFHDNNLTSERYTKLWIGLINQLEKSKENVAVH